MIQRKYLAGFLFFLLLAFVIGIIIGDYMKNKQIDQIYTELQSLQNSLNDQQIPVQVTSDGKSAVEWEQAYFNMVQDKNDINNTLQKTMDQLQAQKHHGGSSSGSSGGY